MSALLVVRAVLAAVCLAVAVFTLVLVGLAAAMRTRPYDLLPPHASPPRRPPAVRMEDRAVRPAPLHQGGAGRSQHRPRCNLRSSDRRKDRNP